MIARYEEDISWANDLRDWTKIVVQKENGKDLADMPNAGREPASFCWAIAKHWNEIKPKDVWAFVQGKPWDHCPSLRESLDRPDLVKGYTPLGGTKTVEGDGSPDHPNLPVARKYREWFGQDWSGPREFTPGGQFMVLGRDILASPKDSYVYLMDDVTTAYNAWVAERLWSKIFEH